jgi:predicted ArsR family transcriptional regulator
MDRALAGSAASGLFVLSFCGKIHRVDVRELTWPDPGAAPALGESRSEVLAALRSAGAPLTAGGVAGQVGLHPNTARFHLDALVEAGLADRRAEDREQPGRPRVLYTARPEHAGARSYRLLAEILSGYLAATTPQPAAAAVAAGQAWGRYLAERPPPFRRLDAEASIRQLVRVLDDIGFAPEAVTAGTGRQVLLRHCPFREIAEEHGEVVCSIHLGLMRGLLTELDAPVAAERLDPFVEPSLCVAHLVSREDPG